MKSLSVFCYNCDKVIGTINLQEGRLIEQIAVCDACKPRIKIRGED